MSPLIWIQPAHLGGLFFACVFPTPTHALHRTAPDKTVSIIIAGPGQALNGHWQRRTRVLPNAKTVAPA
jgi:hypothetical protein